MPMEALRSMGGTKNASEIDLKLFSIKTLQKTWNSEMAGSYFFVIRSNMFIHACVKTKRYTEVKIGSKFYLFLQLVQVQVVYS